MHHARSFPLSWVCIKGISWQFMVPSHSWIFTLTVFPMYKKKLRLKLHMCLNNNGVQKVNFFSFLILVEKFPTPCFCCIMFLCNFHKSSLILSLLRMNLFHCRLRSLKLLFFVFHSLECIKMMTCTAVN